jgi:hypothetical protein
LEESNTQSAEIRLTVSGECIAEINIFDTNGKRLEKATYNCLQEKILILNINYTGVLIVYAESENKTNKKIINVANGKTTEITIPL